MPLRGVIENIGLRDIVNFTITENAMEFRLNLADYGGDIVRPTASIRRIGPEVAHAAMQRHNFPMTSKTLTI